MRQCLLILLGLSPALLLATPNPLRAETTNDALAPATVLEKDVAYLRIGPDAKNLADEIGAERHALDATNQIAGTVLDLRFADSDDYAAARAAADLFAAKKLPLAVLVNGETRGAVVVLAAELQAARDGLIFGSATPSVKSPAGKVFQVQPDIPIAASLDDERAFLKDPFGTLAQEDTNSISATNNFLPAVDHTTEADLVREKIKDGDEDDNATPPPNVEAHKPFLRDPVLARAVDLIQGLVVVRQSRF